MRKWREEEEERGGGEWAEKMPITIYNRKNRNIFFVLVYTEATLVLCTGGQEHTIQLQGLTVQAAPFSYTLSENVNGCGHGALESGCVQKKGWSTWTEEAHLGAAGFDGRGEYGSHNSSCSILNCRTGQY